MKIITARMITSMIAIYRGANVPLSMIESRHDCGLTVPFAFFLRRIAEFLSLAHLSLLAEARRSGARVCCG